MPLRPGSNSPGHKTRASRVAMVAGVVLTVVVLGILLVQVQRILSKPIDPPVEVTLSGAVEAIDAGKVARLHLDDGSRRAVLVLTTGVRVTTAYPDGSGPDLAERARNAKVKVTASPNRNPPFPWLSLLLNLLPVALLIGFFVFFMGPKMGLGQPTKAKHRPAEVPATRFSDVAGVDEAVTELAEVVEFLHAPARFQDAGARVPHGFLLVGPPGTGKTLLARAVAGEAGVPFFSLAGSDFVETFVGVGAARVRQAFAATRREGRAIVFIDEIDAVGKLRTAGPAGSGSEERENTLNQLLVEMDGFVESGVIVLGATNRAELLDPALTRPGRFDRRIAVPAPDRVGRTRILELYARDRSFATDVDFVSLARRTPGLTGADLSFLINEAALEAARTGSRVINNTHLDSALATAMMGRERRSAVVTPRDRRITAWHEAGHAVAALVLPHADDPVSVTIVPRGEAGGVTWMGGNDHAFVTRSEAEARLTVAMAGRAAEEVHLDGDFTQGAASDFASATSLAQAMVTEYGMSELGVTCRSGPLHAGLQPEEVAAAVDALLTRAMKRAREVVAQHRRLVEAVADELLAEERVNATTLAALARRHTAPAPDAPALADCLA